MRGFGPIVSSILLVAVALAVGVLFSQIMVSTVADVKPHVEGVAPTGYTVVMLGGNGLHIGVDVDMYNFNNEYLSVDTEHSEAYLYIRGTGSTSTILECRNVEWAPLYIYPRTSEHIIFDCGYLNSTELQELFGTDKVDFDTVRRNAQLLLVNLAFVATSQTTTYPQNPRPSPPPPGSSLALPSQPPSPPPGAPLPPPLPGPGPEPSPGLPLPSSANETAPG